MDADTLARLDAEILLDEAKRPFLYDDATGKRIVAGSVIVGNVTGGIGINFSVGLDEEEIQWLYRHRRDRGIESLKPFDWFTSQDPVRQAALVDLVFNLNLHGLLHWPRFLAAIAAHDYVAAGLDIKGNTVWRAQVGPRADRIEHMIETGTWANGAVYVG